MLERFGRWIDRRVEKVWVGRLLSLAMIPLLLFLIVAFTGFTVVGIIMFIQWATN